MNLAFDMTHKLTTEEMGRMSAEEFRASERLPLVVVLDNVRSKNNIGSIFRTGDAMGIAEICLCGITATPPDREIHKTALGAEESVPWTACDNIHTALDRLQAEGYRLYAVELAHNSLKLGTDTVATDKPIALIFGNEIEGVQESVMAQCDGFLEIPQYGSKHSLNVSCAAAIALWEISKQLRTENQPI